jgi:hypothetical protein
MAIVLMGLLPTPFPVPLDHFTVLNAPTHRQYPLPPNCLVLQLGPQNSLNDTDSHSLVSIEAHLLQAILIALTATPLDPDPHQQIPKIPLPMVLVALPLHQDLLIIDYSRLDMDYLLRMA